MGLTANTTRAAELPATRACLDRAAALVGRAGLIQWFQHYPPSPVDPPVFKVVPLPARTALLGGGPGLVESCGMALTQAAAEAAAVGEFLERYCSGFVDRSTLLRASERELGAEAVAFRSLGIYAEEQYLDPSFPFAAPRPEAARRWARGRWLDGAGECWVPACCVYLPYFTDDRQDYLTAGVSTGQACHVDPQQAVLSGLYEVVERDAFMLTWLHRVTPPRVDLQAEGLARELFGSDLDTLPVRASLFDITLDLEIPVMLALVESLSRRGPMWALGAAARLDPREAARKALIEAVSDLRYARNQLEARSSWRPGPDFANVETFADHTRLYCEPDMGRHLRFLLEAGPPQPLRPPKAAGAVPAEDLQACLALLARRGLRPLVVDLTTPDVAAAGFSCQKVLVPGAVPIWALHRVPSFGSPRLRSVPERLGWPRPARLNPIPHPFP